MNEKVVFKGRIQTDEEIIIRYPTKEDLNSMWEYINTLSQERTFIRYQGEKISLDEEEKYLNLLLEKIAKKEAVQLLVICEGKIVGVSDVEMQDKTAKHLGIFGITVAKDFRGRGIGTKLMETVINEAERNINKLEIIILEVFANNDLAKDLYKRFGFLQYGMLPNGVRLEKGYQDRVFMYRVVKR